MLSNNGSCLCACNCAVHVTIFSNGSIIPPSFKFTKLHGLTLAALFYALLGGWIKLRWNGTSGGNRGEEEGKMLLVTFFVLFHSRALPFVLDSDEEVMTTRFELSKMN